MQPSDFTVIHAYTRAQAIADGMLIDITPMAAEAGITLPTVVSANLYHDHIVPPADTVDLGQSIEGRLWDVLMVFRASARHAEENRIEFPVDFVSGRLSNGAPTVETVRVIAMVHPGDNGEPVITIMLPGDE